jgi:hypothetical protein
MRSKRTAFIGVVGLTALLVFVVAIAQSAQNSSDTSSQDDPTHRDSTAKAADAAVPTRTAYPSSPGCTATGEVCTLAEAARPSLAQDAASFKDLVTPTTLTCPAQTVPSLQPLCSPGATVSGFFTGVFAQQYQFVTAPEFQTFVERVSKDSGTNLVSVGCPAGAQDSLNCERFAVVVLGGKSDANVLVLMAAPDPNGDLRIIGARSWATSAPEVRGGTTDYQQLYLPYAGPMLFVPIRQ